MEDKMRRTLLTALVLLLLVGIVTIFYIQGQHGAYSYYDSTHRISANRANTNIGNSSNATLYIYYTLKQSTGFVLARAPRGSSGQPLGDPQPVVRFSNDFGLAESDSVLSMQLSPDGRYLAIDGTGDHGEQVWIYDTQRMTISLTPAYVLGNFLHWMSGGTGHSFLYRPMFPQGPAAPMDSNGWNPGLWEVDAATGAHKNIDIHVPSAYLVDAISSPDGSRIIYSTTVGLGAGSDTWLMNSNGSGITHLFNNPGGAQSIAALFTWSPDGKTVAYERLSDSPIPFLPAGLWIMNATGGQQYRLADADGGHGYAPVWSPDSRKIAFVARTNAGDRQADLQMQSLQCAIAVVDVTTRQSWIAASANQTGMQLNYNPSWTADSASVTFTASNPVNRVLGGMPRYWSARAVGPHMQPAVSPLTPVMAHVIAGS
jgi:Tol biopolymer transport system component